MSQDIELLLSAEDGCLLSLLPGCMPVGDVQALSESEDEGPLIPEVPLPIHQPRKRKRNSGPRPPEIESAQQDSAHDLRALLGKRCKCKRRDCMSLFTGERFQPLLEYRKSFLAMHKLDKDHAVP